MVTGISKRLGSPRRGYRRDPVAPPLRLAGIGGAVEVQVHERADLLAHRVREQQRDARRRLVDAQRSAPARRGARRSRPAAAARPDALADRRALDARGAGRAPAKPRGAGLVRLGAGEDRRDAAGRRSACSTGAGSAGSRPSRCAGPRAAGPSSSPLGVERADDPDDARPARTAPRPGTPTPALPRAASRRAASTGLARGFLLVGEAVRRSSATCRILHPVPMSIATRPPTRGSTSAGTNHASIPWPVAISSHTSSGVPGTSIRFSILRFIGPPRSGWAATTSRCGRPSSWWWRATACMTAALELLGERGAILGRAEADLGVERERRLARVEPRRPRAPCGRRARSGSARTRRFFVLRSPSAVGETT